MQLADRSPGAFMGLLFVIVFGAATAISLLFLTDGAIAVVLGMVIVLVGALAAAKFMNGMLGSEEESVGAVHEIDVEMMEALESAKPSKPAATEAAEPKVLVASH